MLTTAVILFLIVTVLMVITILLQSSKNDGIGAGFGALGGTQVFGGRGANDFLKKSTTYLAILYGVGTIFLSFLYKGGTSTSTENALLKDAKAKAVQTAPAADQLNLPEAGTDTPIDSAQ